MIDLDSHLHKAKTSSFSLWILNRFLSRLIPFNSPHKFKIDSIDHDHVTTFAAYKKFNFNHIRGIHACAIATIGELASGILLLTNFSQKEYRIIMAKLGVDYHYQAKNDLKANCQLEAEVRNTLIEKIEQDGKVTHRLDTEVHDVSSQHVATVYTDWQIKPWRKVKTKL